MQNEADISNPKVDEDVVRYVDPAIDKQTLLRLDLLLVPLLASMYLLAFLDRANIGNARVVGLQENLDMTDTQYQIGKSHCSLQS